MEGDEFASIEQGNMTFGQVRIEPAPDGERIDVIGYYQGSESTSMRVNPGCIDIGGLPLGEVTGEFYLMPAESDGFVNVTVEDDQLEISRYD
jgi:hypothetical protein